MSIKSFSKSALGFMSNFNPTSITYKKNSLFVFTFHEVKDSPSEFLQRYGLATSINLFRAQIEWISRRFELIGVRELLENKIPSCAAMITFDDGWSGSFTDALPYLVDNKVPSLHFLNMATVNNQEPILPALISCLEKDNSFIRYMNSLNIEKPYYLYITPVVLAQYLQIHETKQDVLAYQGEIVSNKELKNWENNSYVYLGNHLFQHWNAAILSPEELTMQYKLNSELLKSFRNYYHLFSIPHGQWKTCFSQSKYLQIKELGAKKIFANCGTVNPNKENQLLDRINVSKDILNHHQLDFAINKRIVRKGYTLQEMIHEQ